MANLLKDLNPVKGEPPVRTTPPSRPAALLKHQSTAETSVKSEPQEVLVESRPLLPPVPLSLPNPSDISAEVHQLHNLATAIHAFHRKFDELQKHFDFIDEAIKTRSGELTQTPATMPHPARNTCATFSAISSAQLKQTVTTGLGTLKDNNLKSNVENLKDKAEPFVGSVANEDLISLCKTMCSRGLRKYMVSHLSDTAKLREHVPLALKLAPKPAKLVIDSVGRFYLQGSKAFTNPNSPALPGRNASILILECFLLSECAEKKVALDVSVKDETNSAAIAWKKRLIAEGGLSKADQIDARGLLMLIAGFGIPDYFKAKDLTDIIRVSNAREIAHVLRKSHVLRVRIPDVIKGMIEKGLTVEAVDLTYIFGFEEKFSPKAMLTSFLKRSEEDWERARQNTNSSYCLLKEANDIYLAALKSVLHCLEGHKIDWMGLLPGWKIKEKIANFTRGVPDSSKRTEEKVLQKRKLQKIEPSDKIHGLETKRSKFMAKDSSLVSASVTASKYHQTAVNENGTSVHDDSMPESLAVAGPSRHLQYYPVASSAETGGGVGSLLAIVPFIGGGGMPAGTGVNSKEPASGYNKDLQMDKAGTSEVDHFTSSTLYEITEVASCNDKFSDLSFAGQPAPPRPNRFLGNLPSLVGFPGFLDCQTDEFSNDNASTDLYRFVDAVVESEYDP